MSKWKVVCFGFPLRQPEKGTLKMPKPTCSLQGAQLHANQFCRASAGAVAGRAIVALHPFTPGISQVQVNNMQCPKEGGHCPCNWLRVFGLPCRLFRLGGASPLHPSPPCKPGRRLAQRPGGCQAAKVGWMGWDRRVFGMYEPTLSQVKCLSFSGFTSSRATYLQPASGGP